MIRLQQGSQVRQPQGGHESQVVRTRTIILLGAALVAILVLSLLFTFWLLGVLTRDSAAASLDGRKPALLRQTADHPINIIDDISQIRQTLEAEQREVLQASQPADVDTGIARMPIEQAMRTIAERGLPDFSAGTTQPADVKPQAKGESSNVEAPDSQ